MADPKKAPAKKLATKKVVKKVASTSSAKKAVAKKPVKKSTVKTPAKKTPAKKTPAKKTPVKKAVAKKPVKKPVKKASAKKASPKKPAKKVTAKKVVKKAPAKKATSKKVTAKKVTAKKVTAKKSERPLPSKSAPTAKSDKDAPTSKGSANKAVEEKIDAEVIEPPAPPVIKKFGNVVQMPKKKIKPVPGITKVISPRPTVTPKVLVVREDESPWTKSELNEIRKALNLDEVRLLEEIDTAEIGLADLIRDSGDGAGDDQADAGSKTFEREHEMSLANNAREMLLQVRHALGRIDDKTYGVCEGCGKAIGKLRLQAFPRATLCMACKVAEERY